MNLVRGRINKVLTSLYMYIFTIITLIPFTIFNYLYLQYPIMFFVFCCFFIMSVGSIVTEKIYINIYKAVRASGGIVIPQYLVKFMLITIMFISSVFFVITYSRTGELLTSAIIPYHFLNGAFIWIYIVDTAVNFESKSEIRVDKLRKEGVKIEIFRL